MHKFLEQRYFKSFFHCLFNLIDVEIADIKKIFQRTKINKNLKLNLGRSLYRLKTFEVAVIDNTIKMIMR